MLSLLRVRQFRIIEHLEIQFPPGLSVITGETGAGKSALLDALGFVVGERVSPAVIRAGAEKAEVTAVFDSEASPRALAWLRKHDLNEDGECILHRVLRPGGRSLAHVNGVPVTLARLRDLGAILLDLHRQGAHRMLLQGSEQLYLVDLFGGCLKQRSEVREWFEKKKSLRRQLKKAQASQQGSAERLELLNYQLQELQEARLEEGEFEKLETEFAELSRVDERRTAVGGAVEDLYEGDASLAAVLDNQIAALQKLGSPNLDSTLSLMVEAQTCLDEAVGELRAYQRDIVSDPARLQELDERIGLIHDLARKHRRSPVELVDLAAQLQAEREVLEMSDNQLQILSEELLRAEKTYLDLALQLRALRIQAVESLMSGVNERLPELGMAGGSFTVKFEQRDERPGATGLDEVEYGFSGGRGQKPGSLADVASGGELSRLSLALRLVTAALGPPPVLIFDEVDTGISGAAGEMVGQLLRRLGERVQTLCVTHLPQVAAQGHCHFLVSKNLEGDEAVTQIHELSGDSRPRELARMMGGLEISEQAAKLAEEMLTRPERRPPSQS